MLKCVLKKNFCCKKISPNISNPTHVHLIVGIRTCTINIADIHPSHDQLITLQCTLEELVLNHFLLLCTFKFDNIKEQWAKFIVLCRAIIGDVGQSSTELPRSYDHDLPIIRQQFNRILYSLKH